MSRFSLAAALLLVAYTGCSQTKSPTPAAASTQSCSSQKRDETWTTDDLTSTDWEIIRIVIKSLINDAEYTPNRPKTDHYDCVVVADQTETIGSEGQIASDLSSHKVPDGALHSIQERNKSS